MLELFCQTCSQRLEALCLSSVYLSCLVEISAVNSGVISIWTLVLMKKSLLGYLLKELDDQLQPEAI